MRQAEREELVEALDSRVGEQRQVDEDTGCWLFTGRVNNSGYASIGYGGKKYMLHRFSYMAYVGDIEGGKIIMHTCDTPRCFNPDHLQLGTHSQNVADAYRKGRKVATFRKKVLSHEEAEEIRFRYAQGELQRELAEAYGVSDTTISRIVNYTRWAA